MNQPEPRQFETPSWVERHGFSDWALAVIWIGVSFFLFQLVSGLVAIILVLLTGPADPGADFLTLLNDRIDILFIGNSTGQILFLGLATWLVTGLHIRNRTDQPKREARKLFLRLKTRHDTGWYAILSAVLFLVVQPLIWYLGYLNSLIPVPDYFTELQDSQYEMIERFLRSDGVLLMGLVNIALVPAICEEVMFRGYVQRAFEKNGGVWIGLIASSLLFGLFHLQLTNLLPLASLGFLLALVTWLSGSLIPAMVAHFMNNGSAVLLSHFYPDLAFAEMTAETAPPLWTLGVSILFSGMIIWQLVYQSEQR